MSGKIIMSAPEMDLYISRYHSNGLDSKPIALCEEGDASFSALLEEIKQIKPSKTDPNYWAFFFPVPRGGLKQFIRYSEYCDEERMSEEEIKASFARCYPHKQAWFKMKVVAEGDYCALMVDGGCFARRNPREKPFFWTDFALNRINAYLLQVVRKVVQMLKEGTYNDYVEKNLPYEYRDGVIKRSLYWKLVKGSKQNDLEGLRANEIKTFLKNGDLSEVNGDGYRVPKGRLTPLTSGKYYELCAICYRAARYKDLEKKTPKQMFERYGDDRDGGLSTLDENSPEEFERWMALSGKEKWEIENSSHMWEIVEGHTHTMVHLYPEKKEDGYCFYLYGGLHCMTDEVVRMFNALCEEGVPVVLGDYDEIAKKLRGEDNLGIIPFKKSGWVYWYGGFQDKDAVNFVNFPEGNEEEVKKRATWFPLSKLELAQG